MFRVWFLAHRHYRQIAHRDPARGGFPHAPDCIDSNGHGCNVAVRPLELDFQIRLASDLDGVPIVSLVQRGYEGQGHELALAGVGAGYLLEASHFSGLHLKVLGLDTRIALVCQSKARRKTWQA